MDYKNLIVGKRLRTSSNPVPEDLNRAFDSDRGRVLFSAPFRRLQSKAQVFSLESNAAVRSRLTHSLEVAHIGRYIAQQLKWLLEDDHKGHVLIEHSESIETIIETSCLLHDIGNPPFGHLGERAIQTWFTENSENLYELSTNKGLNRDDPSYKKIDCEDARYKDFENFDGNPQGLRIVLHLQGNANQGGLNLTLTQIASIVKYPQLSTETKKHKKIGIFTSELEEIQLVWNGMGLEWGKRHFLVYLMEAADDIAYSFSDIEDGIEKGIITEEFVFENLKGIFIDPDMSEFSELILKAKKVKMMNSFVYFRTQMINILTKHAANKFFENEKEILEGDFGSIFDKDAPDPHSKAIHGINSFCFKNVYNSAEAVDIELAGYNIVFSILEKFSILLKLPESDFERLVSEGKGSDICRRMYAKLPNSLVEIYSASVDKDPSKEWYIRTQLIVDFLSGMTDEFALKVHKLLHGIQVEIL